MSVCFTVLLGNTKPPLYIVFFRPLLYFFTTHKTETLETLKREGVNRTRELMVLSYFLNVWHTE